ncbi:MAG: thiol reductase thioredoxin [Deltaproteobacteria bacterium]|nr:thiol reductase thioredoxin [Deltaproteobacteria bacterium]
MSWLGLEAQPEADPVALDDANFRKEVLESDLPVLVDIWSDGCMPCRTLVPTIRRLASKYEGKVKVGQLNVRLGYQSVSELGVSGTPTVLFFKRGKVVERVVGIRGQHYYEEVIETDLLEPPAPEDGAAPAE